MERTHPRDGELALLQCTVSKGRVHGDEEMVVFALCEVYETMAGVENHIRLAHDDQEDSGYVRLSAWARKCESIHGSTQVIHSLW